MTVKSLLIILLFGVAYVASTLFYFGSANPCEILVVRQKDHRIGVAEKLHQADLQSWKEMARTVLPAKDYSRFVHNIEEFSNSPARQENLQRTVMIELRQKFREMTLAQCAWQAVTWHQPSVRVSDTSSQN